MTLPTQQRSKHHTLSPPCQQRPGVSGLSGVCLTWLAGCVPVLVSSATSENPAAKVSMLWGRPRGFEV